MGKSGDARQAEESRPPEVGKGAERRRKRIGMLQRSFEFTIMLKGIHAGLEIMGAALLGFVNPASLGRWVMLLTQSELAEDPHDPMIPQPFRRCDDRAHLGGIPPAPER
jgi:hypothetical protein